METHKLTVAAKKILKPKYCGAVIVAAGSASRMGGVDKILAPLGNTTVIAASAKAFQDCDVIKEIVIVTRPDQLEQVAEVCMGFDKVKAVVAGGASRPESVMNGLHALSKKVKLAAIHDGARPLATPEMIDRVVRAAGTWGAAAPGVPVKDTIKQTQKGIVTGTPDRSALRAIQTPQIFDYDLLVGALENAAKKELAITDDCSAVEALGMSMRIVDGLEENIKITTPMDLKLANMLWEERE